MADSRNQNDLKQVDSEHLAEMPIKLADIQSSCDNNDSPKVKGTPS